MKTKIKTKVTINVFLYGMLSDLFYREYNFDFSVRKGEPWSLPFEQVKFSHVREISWKPSDEEVLLKIVILDKIDLKDTSAKGINDLMERKGWKKINL
jgi:hypothetical protein